MRTKVIIAVAALAVIAATAGGALAQGDTWTPSAEEQQVLIVGVGGDPRWVDSGLSLPPPMPRCADVPPGFEGFCRQTLEYQDEPVAPVAPVEEESPAAEPAGPGTEPGPGDSGVANESEPEPEPEPEPVTLADVVAALQAAERGSASQELQVTTAEQDLEAARAALEEASQAHDAALNGEQANRDSVRDAAQALIDYVRETYLAP